MANLSAMQFAEATGVNTVSALADKAGLAARPISLKAVIHALGDPLQPTQLGLFWDFDQYNRIIFHPADDQSVPLNNVQFQWTDPGSDNPIRKHTSFVLTVKIAATGKVFETGPLSGTGDFMESTSYSWSVYLVNSIGQGPDSPSYTFKTVGAAAPAPPPVVPPKIQVTYTGPPQSAVFEIKGTGFLPSSAVYVRGVNDAGAQSAFQQTNSDGTGAIDVKVSIPCIPGTKLSFSANDGRQSSADLTGTLWSNTVTVQAG